MRIIRYLLTKYLLWRMKDRLEAAKGDVTIIVPCELILDLLKLPILKELSKYKVKYGYSVWLTTEYNDVASLLRNLALVEKALKEDDLRPISKRLARQDTKKVLLADHLVDDLQYSFSITTVEEELRTRVSNIHAIIIAADSEVQKYYLRKLTNILRESLVVTEALLQAADLTWHHRIMTKKSLTS